MLKVTLAQWRMFKAVVTHGGFNQAATAIHKSQSSIHSAVSKIEAALGVKLFSIEGKKTKLTEAGELMLRRAEFLLSEAEKLEAVGATLAEGVETHLRIAVDEIFPHDILYQVLEKTSQIYPQLRIELMESVLTGASELLNNTQVDIAISPIVGHNNFSEELCRLAFLAVAHPEHPLQLLERELTLEDLKSYRQIVVRDSALTKRIDSGWLGAEQRWTVSHIRTSVDMISKGFGYAWLPHHLICEHLAQGKLKPLNLGLNTSRNGTLYLTFKDGDKLGPAARTFLGELRLNCMEQL